MAYGQKSFLGINFQDSGGTAATTSMHWIPFLSEEIGIEKPPLVDVSMRGIFDEGDHFEGANVGGGDITIPVNARTLGVLLKAALGDPTTVSSGASLFTHTFLPATSDFDDLFANQPVTVYKSLDIPDTATLIFDLVGNALELSVNNGEFLTAKLGFSGARQQDNPIISPTIPTNKLMTWAVSSVDIVGVTPDIETDLSQLTITLEQVERCV